MAARLNLTEEAYRALEKGRTIRLEWDTILLLLGILTESGESWEHFFYGDPQPAAEPAPRPTIPAAERLPKIAERPPAPAVPERVAASQPVTKVAAEPEPRVAIVAAGAEGEGIPVLTTTQIGQSLNLKTSKLAVRGVPRLRLDPPITGAVLGIRIEGDALTTEYRDGDVAVCRSGSPESNKPGFLLLRDRECLLCLGHAESAHRIRLIPVDPDLPVRTVDRSQIVAAYAPVRKLDRARLPGGLGGL